MPHKKLIINKSLKKNPAVTGNNKMYFIVVQRAY